MSKKQISVEFRCGVRRCIIKIKPTDAFNSEVSVFWFPNPPIEGKEEIHEIMAINYINHIKP